MTFALSHRRDNVKFSIEELGFKQRNGMKSRKPTTQYFNTISLARRNGCVLFFVPHETKEMAKVCEYFTNHIANC